MTNGNYYRTAEVEAAAPGIMEEWYAWLDAQRDPGHYDSYKVKDSSILPYVDGKPQWVCDVYMPSHIEAKLPAGIRI